MKNRKTTTLAQSGDSLLNPISILGEEWSDNESDHEEFSSDRVEKTVEVKCNSCKNSIADNDSNYFDFCQYCTQEVCQNCRQNIEDTETKITKMILCKPCFQFGMHVNS